ncbi:VTT domain-containing protein [Cupriavidus basilensis]|uniref:VTT domain-containing protein n=1 Tax=Cupriavidus basilensis TaxID=68895 RepID=A0ABT6ATU3_9BURK|nr:VTT domain-containing protein [Cupriavidus basilensis]MDF3836046.1 VTT domain-containing protein [Cupriavidus basilensis]
MLTTGLFGWLSSDHHLMALMAQNWWLGVLIVAGIVFLETGLVVLPFLPGDSLLFTTGAFLGASGISPLWAILLTGLAAVLGDGVNYLVGRSAAGQWLIRRGWITPRHLQKTRAYFDRFGAPTVTIGRFVPIVRTVTPFLAGLSGMCPRRFALYNVLGAMMWCPGLLLAGYWLGGIPWVRGHMSWLTAGIVVASLLPVLFQLRRGALATGG